MKGAFSRIALALALALAGTAMGTGACSHAAPDATPEGVVRLWLETMEASAQDAHAMRDAYGLLGKSARQNLAERAERAGRVQGRSVAPYEMLAEGRFGLRFRPKGMTAVITGDHAVVNVVGSDSAVEQARVQCTHEREGWRVDPELPEVQPLRRSEGG